MFVDGYPLALRALSPDAPEEIITQLSKSPALAKHKEEFIKGARARQQLMIWRQERLNSVNQLLEHRRSEALGEKIASIDMEVYFQMMELYGPDCWGDPKFIEDFLEKNPGTRIRVENEKLTVAVPENVIQFQQPRTSTRTRTREGECHKSDSTSA